MESRTLARALTELLNSPDELPVPIKAFIASVAICQRGAAPSRLGMAKTGNYSYGSSQTHYPELLSALIKRIPNEITRMSPSDHDPARAVHLQDELRQRDATIHDLRRAATAHMETTEHLRRYALALQQRVAELEKGEAAHHGRPVRPLRPLD